MALRKAEECPELFEKPDEYVTYDELARILGVTTRMLRQYVACKRIPFKRVGSRTIRFSKTEIEAWLHKRSNMR